MGKITHWRQHSRSGQRRLTFEADVQEREELTMTLSGRVCALPRYHLAAPYFGRYHATSTAAITVPTVTGVQFRFASVTG